MIPSRDMRRRRQARPPIPTWDESPGRPGPKEAPEAAPRETAGAAPELQDEISRLTPDFIRAHPGRFPAGDASVDLGEINIALGSDINGTEPFDIQRRLPEPGRFATDPESLHDFAHRFHIKRPGEGGTKEKAALIDATRSEPRQRSHSRSSSTSSTSTVIGPRTVLPNPHRTSRRQSEQRGRSIETGTVGSSATRRQPSHSPNSSLRRLSLQELNPQSPARPHGTASSSRTEEGERYRQLRSGSSSGLLSQQRPLPDASSPINLPQLSRGDPPSSTPRPRHSQLHPNRQASRPTHYRTFSGQVLPLSHFERIEGGFGGVAMMQRTPSNQGMAPQNGNGNGMNNGAPMGQISQMSSQMPVGAMPVGAGQQMDIHVLYSKVMELSEILKENREATQGIVQSAEQLAFRAAQSGSSEHIQEADREISASRIATLTHQNSLVASQLSTLKHENRENTKLIGEYETAMGQIAEMVRDLSFRKDTARLAAEREYNARLQKEKDDHLETRHERDRWHTEYLRVVGMLRTAYALRESEEDLPTRVVAQLQSEVRALRDVAGLERERPEDEAGWDVLKFVPESEVQVQQQQQQQLQQQQHHHQQQQQQLQQQQQQQQ